MLRLLYAVVLGLIGAGIVHVVILLLLPGYATRDAFTRLAAEAAPYETVRLAAEDVAARAPTPANPFLRAVACRFDLADGMLHVSGEGHVPFWSVSIYDGNGLNVFSISDRAATDKTPDLVVLSPPQMLSMRNELAADFTRSIFVETDSEEGVVVVRVFVPDETWEDLADAFLAAVACEPRPLP